MEGYLRYFGNDYLEIKSAGIEIHGLNPRAIAIMQEDRINISHQTSNQIDEYQDIAFNYVLTVCDHAAENCPYFPSSSKRIHNNFPDPTKAKGEEEEIMQEFRMVRDLIKNFAKDFIKKEFIGNSI